MNNYNENDIRVAAYYNWLNSGCQNGNDLQNWNAAVAQIAGTSSVSATVLKTSARKINNKASASIAAGKALSKATKMVAKKVANKKAK